MFKYNCTYVITFTGNGGFSLPVMKDEIEAASQEDKDVMSALEAHVASELIGTPFENSAFAVRILLLVELQ